MFSSPFQTHLFLVFITSIVVVCYFCCCCQLHSHLFVFVVVVAVVAGFLVLLFVTYIFHKAFPRFSYIFLLYLYVFLIFFSFSFISCDTCFRLLCDTSWLATECWHVMLLSVILRHKIALRQQFFHIFPFPLLWNFILKSLNIMFFGLNFKCFFDIFK